MGLPVFITPVEPEVPSKAAEKIASGPRSSIRRSRNDRSAVLRRSSPLPQRRIRRMRDMFAPDSDTNESRILDGPDLEEPYTLRQSPPPMDRDLTSVPSLQARAQRMFETERMRLRDRDPLSFERQHPPVSDADGYLVTPMPPVPESRDYSEIDGSQVVGELERMYQVRRDLRRLARRRPAPTPPYTDRDLAVIARMRRTHGRDSTGLESPRLPSLTPPLSSRSPSHRSPEREQTETFNLPEFIAATRRRTPPARPTRTTSALSERIQAAHRASNSSRRALRQTRLDGLGDRERSLSPDAPGGVWDTLLATITPDPQPPSIGSSFASSSASAAAATSSTNQGPTSGNTSMTSVNETGEALNPRDCDVSESNTEDEDEDDMYELREDRFIHANELDEARDRERSWRSSWAEVAQAGRAIQNSGDSGLNGMHRIISRLAERDDIPESWWASVGLRREPTA